MRDDETETRTPSDTGRLPSVLPNGAGLLGCLLLLPTYGAAEVGLADNGAPHHVVISRIEEAPRLEDFFGMAPSGSASAMTRVEGFTTRVPRDGEPITERTVAYLGYDEKSLHVVFVSFDSDPAGIRSHLAGRDRIPDSDDGVAVQLDTFRDQEHAYGFQVNPRGVQLDGFWTEGTGWDLSFDTVWTSEGMMTPQGYVVLVSIPFTSLRFPRKEVQEWGLLLFRGIARKNEQAFWPAYSTKIAGRMNQAGLLAGLEDISPGRNAQIIPYTSGRSFRVLDASSFDAPRFVSKHAELDAGLDAKLVVRDSVAVDVTVNPDFSQVESDEPQITVNQRFETFFPEKRPFFLENASFFDTPIPLLFTRRILQPQVGARVTGRMGPYAVAGLIVSDRPDARPDSEVGVFRLQRDIGAESSVGTFVGTRAGGSAVNRVVSLDSRLKIAPQWVGNLQAATSLTEEPDGRRASGTAYHASLSRAGEKLNYEGVVGYTSPGFESAIGFIERRDVLSLDQSLSYRERPAESRLLSWGPDLFLSEVRDHRNRPLDRSVTPRLAFEWPGQTNLVLFYQEATVRLRPLEVPSVSEELTFGQNRAGIEFATSFSRKLSVALNASRGGAINLAPPSRFSPRLGRSDAMDLSASLRPSTRLSVDVRYLLTKLTDADSGTSVFLDQIVRTKLGFQFTRALSVRTIVQYDSLAVEPRETALETRRNVNFDVLLTWQPSPWTALFVGYNDNRANIDPSLEWTPRGLLRTPGHLIQDGRQVFAKFSFLFSVN